MAKDEKQGEKNTGATAESGTGVGSAVGDMEFKTKVSIKSVIGRIKRPAENDPPKKLCTFMGVVRGIKRGEGDKGPWLGFTGDFEGIDATDGHIVRGAELFLPKAGENVLVQAYMEASKPNAEGQTPLSVALEFAIDVDIKPSNNQYGYEYVVKPVIKMSDSDPLAMLRNKVGEARKSLAGPKKVA